MNLPFKIDQFGRKILRKAARTLVRFPAKWYFNRQFDKAFTKNYDAFWIVDIDNTIADSWRKMTPQYKGKFRSVSDRMMSLEPFEAMQQLFEGKPPNTRIVFLTARQYIRYFVTKRWLKKHGFTQADSVLVLVERMKDKVPLLEGVLKKYFQNAPPQYLNDFDPQLSLNDNFSTPFSTQSFNFPITYFDDLSYNHENGEVLFYEAVVEAVKKMPIRYIGYAELLQMQSDKSLM